jgi:7-cyano-7-deazaguanine synthase
MTNRTALVVLSGGMDSVTALAWAASQYDDVHALTANYGQRHVREIEAALWQGRRYASRHDLVDLTSVGRLLEGSSLTDDVDVPFGHYAAETMKATVVPNRNAILANVAAGIAIGRNLDAIVLGIHSGDHTIYPDCRPEFVEALQTCLDVGNWTSVEVVAPFLHGDKRTILLWGHEGLDELVDYSRTWTCYVGGDVSCGRCGSCQERLEAFDSIGVVDPLEYATDRTP